MTLQHIWIIYTLSLKISRQRSLKCDIYELNVMRKFVSKRNDLILNMIILRKCARITLISSNSCDFRINYRINLRNFKINLSTIKTKIKHFRANEITRSTQLKMRDNRIRKSYRQIYLCAFEKIIITISEIKKIVATIIIKLSKHSTKSSTTHVTRKNIDSMIRRVLNTSNDKKNKIVAKKKQEKFESDARRHSIKIKIAKMKITRFNLNSCDHHVF